VSKNQKVVQHVRFKVFAVIQLRSLFFWVMVPHFWVISPMKNSSLDILTLEYESIVSHQSPSATLLYPKSTDA